MFLTIFHRLFWFFRLVQGSLLNALGFFGLRRHFLGARLLFDRGWLRLTVSVRGVASEESGEIVATVVLCFNDFLAFVSDEGHIGPITALEFRENELRGKVIASDNLPGLCTKLQMPPCAALASSTAESRFRLV